MIKQDKDIWEILPTVNAELKFKLAVRDNSALAGRFALANASVQVKETIRPFTVEAPVEDKWIKGKEYLVKWDVADTDIAPINCSAVDIMLVAKFDNFTLLPLALNISNNGSAMVKAPNQDIKQGYIMAICHDNIFYAVSTKAIMIE